MSNGFETIEEYSIVDEREGVDSAL